MADDVSLRIPKPDASVTELVVTKVREAITSGALVAGQKLTEREMMERTGVSRTSVREALRHLQALGLVEPAPGRGLIIPALDREAIEHIYEVREAIEPTAVRLFTVRATDEEIERYAELVFGKRPSGTEVAPEAWPEAWRRNLDADRLVLEVVGNPHFSRLMEPLYARIQQLRGLSAASHERARAATAEMESVVAAIRARQPRKAEKASRRHIEAARASVLRVVDEHEQKAAGLPGRF
ncbi:FCD domain-containing protein [Actinomadura sp. LD22]|uniref:FCD domain-containing protein n=1 Tax=Actinomadura physcomitrii TaxID=2650748 RepID=A0A6I4MJU9_9ACTN|nr:GntR family transcriptional regulator [Actinomadura physcomitrii]MWA04845.1 FCD domain-containing protein [Actinomadura physcomitrii]